MSEKEFTDQEEIHSKVLRAGRRTYFFDVRSTKAGDYYLTVTESKKFTHEDGSFHYKKHKIYLYKEDFDKFADSINEIIAFIREANPQPIELDDSPVDEQEQKTDLSKELVKKEKDFTNVEFEDLGEEGA